MWVLFPGRPSSWWMTGSLLTASSGQAQKSAATAVEALEEALKKTPIRREEIEYTVATGYGRVVVPFADRNITEITCHARGAHFFTPTVRTILDMGGQDCKAIRCDEKGKVKTFLMNDKCAAGTGRSMEVMAPLIGDPPGRYRAPFLEGQGKAGQSE